MIDFSRQRSRAAADSCGCPASLNNKDVSPCKAHPPDYSAQQFSQQMECPLKAISGDAERFGEIDTKNYIKNYLINAINRYENTKIFRLPYKQLLNPLSKGSAAL